MLGNFRKLERAGRIDDPLLVDVDARHRQIGDDDVGQAGRRDRPELVVGGNAIGVELANELGRGSHVIDARHRLAQVE